MESVTKDKSAKTSKRRSLFTPLVFSGIGASRKAVKTAISKSFGFLSEKFGHSSARSYGAMGASFGLLSILIYLGKYYILTEPSLPGYQITMGIIFLALSLPLLLSEKPIAELLQSFALTDYIVFDFFSVKRLDKKEGVKGIQPFSAILIGFVPAFAGVFIEPAYVAIAAALAVFVAVSFVTPEFTLIFTVLAAPYLSPVPDGGLILALLSLLCALSFFLKLIVGKRFYNFEIYDIIFIMISVLFVISGIVNGNIFESFILVCLTLGYSTASNLIVNRRLADRVVNAQIISSVPICILGIVDFAVSLSGNHDYKASALFASAGSFGAFLLITMILSFNFAKDLKSPLKRSLYFAVACLNLVNIILTWQVGLWFTLILTIPAYLIIKNKRIRKEWLILLVAIPYLAILLPRGFTDAFSDFLKLSPTIDEITASWQSGLDIFLQNPIFGIGSSPLYVIHNSFISFAVQFGVLALALIVLLFLIRLLHLSAYTPYMKNSDLAITAGTSALALFSAFSLSMSTDIFADITLYYIFVSVFGIISAALRISKNEYDERVGYYGTVRDEDASDISIRISV